MANAIHKTAGTSETLDSIAALYFAVGSADGGIDDIRQKKIVRAIRRATPVLVTDLSGYADDAALPNATTVFVPTVRAVSRNLLVEDAGLDTALRGAGFDHAGKLLRRQDSDAIVALLADLSLGTFSTDDLDKAIVVTSFFNLDGMDAFTASYLYDDGGAAIKSLSALAEEGPEGIDTILDDLVTAGRPAQLSQQGHGRRWWIEARLYSRKRPTALAKGRKGRHGVPVGPGRFARVAAHYEALAQGSDLAPAGIARASNLARLYRFAEAHMQGNLALRSGRWRAAQRHQQDARAHFHRMVEGTGGGPIDNRVGVNLNGALDAAKALLDTLPANDDNIQDAPEVRAIGGAVAGAFGVRGFTYDELETSGTDQKAAFRAAITGTSVHDLPRKSRDGVKRLSLSKTGTELSEVDDGLVNGITGNIEVVTASTTVFPYAARDLAGPDQETLKRNVGSITIGKTFTGGGNLGIFEAACGGLPVSEMADAIGSLWDGLFADDVLSTAAQTSYPSVFLESHALTTKFVTLPNVVGEALPSFIAVDDDFVANVRDGWMKDRLMSTTGDDLRMPDESWLAPGSLAINAVWSYCYEIPAALGKAYSAVGDTANAKAYGGPLVNGYAPDGSVIRDVAGAAAGSLAFDIDLQSCSTLFGDPEVTASPADPGSYRLFVDLLDYVEWNSRYADNLYRGEDTVGARKWYEDVACAIGKQNPDLVDEVRIGMLGVRDAVEQGDFKASLFDVSYVKSGTTRFVREDFVGSFVSGATVKQLGEAAAAADQLYGWNGPPTGVSAVAHQQPVDLEADSAQAIAVRVFVTEDDQFFYYYTYCIARISAIDLGLNWFGYPNYQVPPWSSDYLYGIARDLCNRALDAEGRVLTLTQALVAVEIDQEKAEQAAVFAQAGVKVAQAQQAQSLASAQASIDQAQLAEQQAALAQEQNAGHAILEGIVVGTAVGTAVVGSVIASAGTDVPALAAAGSAAGAGGSALLGQIESLGGLVGGVAAMANYRAITATAQTAQLDASSVYLSTLVLGNAQVDLANLQASQAIDYLEFLADLPLNSAVYEELLALAKDTAEIYIGHANRVAWLAERALAFETRRSLDFIRTDYGSTDDTYNMTRAQRLTADLEALRATYTAGESVRRQSVKWVVPLSRLAPAALQQLRETGECSFGLMQQAIDLRFPGLYLHSLEEIQVQVIGLLPPDGVRGVLQLSSLSWVRVPNDADFTSDGAETTTDWISTQLVSDLEPADPDTDTALTDYATYIMKQTISTGTELSLSAFDVTRDSTVLRAPQGMLSALQHHGLDTSMRLYLPRTANVFEWGSISDVELTLWFLAAYDDGLASAQNEALWRMGKNGTLQRAAVSRFPLDQPSDWSAFLAGQSDAERLDLRTIGFQLGPEAPFETARLLTNLMIGAKESGSADIDLPVRLLCDTDPVGVAVALSGDPAAAYSAIGIDPPLSDPFPDATFAAWVVETFYSGDPEAQVTTMAVADPGDNVDMTVTVDGVTVTYNTGTGHALAAIGAALAAAINAETEVSGKVTATFASATLTLTGLNPGVAFTVTVGGAGLSSVTTATAADPGAPTVDPEQTFLLKLAPAVAGPDWWLLDEDGLVETTISGPLLGTNNGGTPGTASYDDGTDYLNVAVRVAVAHQGGTVRLRVRGSSGYAIELSPSTVRLLRGTSQVATRSLAYPSTEFVSLELRCWDLADGTTKLQGRIDGIVIGTTTDSTPLPAGTVRLEVTATAAGPVPVQFDDLEVVRLTGLGVEADQLLFEPFTSTLPDGWTFVDGSVAWSISGTGHKILDLSRLQSMGLKIDYRFEIP